jgi:hypothetical protein
MNEMFSMPQSSLIIPVNLVIMIPPMHSSLGVSAERDRSGREVQWPALRPISSNNRQLVYLEQTHDNTNASSDWSFRPAAVNENNKQR